MKKLSHEEKKLDEKHKCRPQKTMLPLQPFQTAPAAPIEEALLHWRAALDASVPRAGKMATWVLVANDEIVRRGKLPPCREGEKSFVWEIPRETPVIFDGCQKGKGRCSLNARLLFAARRQHLRVLLSSATAASAPSPMRSIGFTLGPHTLINFWTWAQRNGVSERACGMKSTGGEGCLGTLHRQNFPAQGRRLRTTNIPTNIPDFPTPVISASLTASGQARAFEREYNQFGGGRASRRYALLLAHVRNTSRPRFPRLPAGA